MKILLWDGTKHLGYICFILTFTSELFSVFVPWLLGIYINALIEQGDYRYSFIKLSCIALCAFIFEQLSTHYAYKMSREWERHMREEVFQTYCHLEAFTAEQMPQGAIGMKLLRDIPILGGLLRDVFPSICKATIGTVFALLVCFWQCWQLGCVVLLLLPFLLMIQWIFQNKFSRINKQQRLIQDKSCSRIFEFFNVFPELRAMGAEEKPASNLEDAFTQITSNDKSLDANGLLFQRCLSVFLLFCEYSILGIAGWYAVHGRLQIGQVVFFQVLILRVMNSCSGLLRVYPQLTIGKEAARSLDELLDKHGYVLTSDHTLENGIQSIELKDVGFGYDCTGHHVVEHINLSLQAGELVAFSGINGSGKTTLWKIVTGYIRPLSGRIIVNSKSDLYLCIKDFRRRIAFVTQRPFLLYGTLKYNITLGAEDDDALRNALDLSGFNVVLKRFSDGIERKIEDGANLSGGECQRLALARALFRKPEILILDEITNHLDTEGRQLILQLLHTMHGKILIIIITHDNEMRQLCDREIKL